MYEKKKIVNGKLTIGGNNDDGGETPCKICDRPKATVKCGQCGYTLANMRLRKTCTVHPKYIDLMDLMNKCPHCKGSFLEEIIVEDAPTKTSFTSTPVSPPTCFTTPVVESCFDPPPHPPAVGRGWRFRSPPVSPPGGGPVVTCNLASLKDPSFVASRKLFNVNDDPPQQELHRAPLSLFKTKQRQSPPPTQDLLSRPVVRAPPQDADWRRPPAVQASAPAAASQDWRRPVTQAPAPAQDWRSPLPVVQEPVAAPPTVRDTPPASNDWRSTPTKPSSFSQDLLRNMPAVREPALPRKEYTRPAVRLEPPPEETYRPVVTRPPAPTQQQNRVVDQNCPCNRPVPYVLCSTCGFYTTGVKKFVRCSIHPNPPNTIRSCPECDAGLDALDEG